MYIKKDTNGYFRLNAFKCSLKVLKSPNKESNN